MVTTTRKTIDDNSTSMGYIDDDEAYKANSRRVYRPFHFGKWAVSLLTWPVLKAFLVLTSIVAKSNARRHAWRSDDKPDRR